MTAEGSTLTLSAHSSGMLTVWTSVIWPSEYRQPSKFLNLTFSQNVCFRSGLELGKMRAGGHSCE